MGMQTIKTGPFSLLVEYEDRVDQQRARGLTSIGIALTLAGGLWLMAVLVSLLAIEDAPLAGAAIYVATYAVFPLAVVQYQAARRGRLPLSAFIFVIITGLLAITAMNGTLYLSNVVLLSIPIAAAGSLMRRPGIAVTIAVLLILAVVMAVVQRQAGETITIIPGNQVISDLLMIMAALAIDGALLWTFGGWVPIVALDAQRDVLALRRVAAFGATLDIVDEDRLLAQALQFTRTDLKFNFSQVFLIGESGQLDVRVRPILGQALRVERARYSGLGETSAVREASQSRRTSRVDRTDAAIRRSHFLPTSICGAVLPLVYADRLIGVLDVQHEAVPYIPDYQILTLQTLADNLAATLATVRQSIALRTTVRQQEETANALRNRLQELTGIGRSGQSGSLRLSGYDVAPDGTLIQANDMPASLRPVLETSKLQVQNNGDERIVRLPISLKNETIGVMSFTVTKDKLLTERQLETASAVANRLALALENKRLLEQTRAQIERERITSDVTNKLISATNVDSVLSVAVENFREVLGAINARIYVQPFDTPDVPDVPLASLADEPVRELAAQIASVTE
jgi:GAF domain-containing protein